MVILRTTHRLQIMKADLSSGSQHLTAVFFLAKHTILIIISSVIPQLRQSMGIIDVRKLLELFIFSKHSYLIRFQITF